MAKNEKKEPEKTTDIEKQEPKAISLPSEDSGPFSILLDTAKFNHMWRVAQVFAGSELVPVQYQNKTENCFIACQMAIRLQVDPFMFMQNTYIVKGRPGMEAKLAIALINTSGLYVDSLGYEIDGKDPFDKKYRVRAHATRKGTGTVIFGPWIDWQIVENEGWRSKEGSKWRTIPGLMFLYRAATFFGRLHCPERMMGMQTVEELVDITVVDNVEVIDKRTKTERLTESLSPNAGDILSTPETIDAPNVASATEPPDKAEPDPDFEANKQKQKDDLKAAEAEGNGREPVEAGGGVL